MFIPECLIFLAGYAEIHFRFFKGFPSLLFKKEPEIIFDMPRRVGPNRLLPVFLFVHHVQAFPLDLESVTISLSTPNMPVRKHHFPSPQLHEINHDQQHIQHAFCFEIDIADLPANCEFFVNCCALVRMKKRTVTILNDNLAGTNKFPFTVFKALNELPGSTWAMYGDLHTHSIYSQSHVEFGPPLVAIARSNAAYGTSFTGLTDHSYDLTCASPDYLKIDLNARQWTNFSRECTAFQEKSHQGHMLLKGEEISCKNYKNEIVHLLSFGHNSFIPGAADGARSKRLPTDTLSINEVVQTSRKEHGVCFAAHPGNAFGLAQKIVFKRGLWDNIDLNLEIAGMQAVNSGFGPSWQRAKKLWVAQLLTGNKRTLIAGNDAHGDFNRYRCIKTPFVSIAESNERYACAVNTGVYGIPANTHQLLELIKAGKTFISNGPFLIICRKENPEDALVGIQKVSLFENESTLRVESSKEFGKIQSVTLIAGIKNGPHEILAGRYKPDHETYTFTESLSNTTLPPHDQVLYIRAECTCMNTSGAITQAITSPMYLSENVLETHLN